MLINLVDILLHDQIPETQEKKLSIETIPFGNEKYRVTDGVGVTLNFKKIGPKEILLDGSIRTDLLLRCDRCNGEVKYHLTTDFSKEVTVESVVEDKDDDFTDGYDLNLDKFVLNEIYLNFPMKVLCDEDCKGVCPICGGNLNQQACNCETDSIDPRLAKLKALFDENFKEV